jgi:4-alpha-glucanotransferase
MNDSLLDRLARQRGIGDAYHNYRGDLVTISRETKSALLAAMGCPTSDAIAIERALQEGEAARWRSLLAPVAVVFPGGPEIIVAVPADRIEDTLRWRVGVDGGAELSGEVRATELRELERGEVTGRWQTRRALRLPDTIPHGYHTLHVALGADAESQAVLIVAPQACFEPEALRAGKRLWGLAVQLYTLRSKSNWGIGDFADLETLVRGAARHGAAYIGLNPLHALFPGNPRHFSPYSPSSRHFLNVLYIAVERTPEFAECDAARRHVADAAFQAELERLRRTDSVDYPGVTRAKLDVLRQLFEHFIREHHAKNSARAAQFHAYVGERGEELHLHALHDAIDEQLRSQGGDRYWGWPVWPDELRDPGNEGVRRFERDHADVVRFHAWLQWVADEQLGAAQRLARELGMPIGLYGDYAVGVNPSGSETWADQAVYRKSAGVGAPPDALALKGQDWGTPPQDPNVLVAERYRPFRELLAANMRHFGALRLDHVMALFRQWWVPVGLGATHGGYVHYPVDDLMSVLALESERHGCLVIGEDLGTVAPQMSHAMAERAVYSYRVLLFEKHGDGRFRRPDEYPRRAIATVTTHDLPTLRGFWTGGDIELRQRLNLYPTEAIRQHVANERVHDRHALLAALEAAGLRDFECDGSPGSYGEPLADRIHVFLARSTTALVVLQIEDLIGILDPVNVPGTSDEYPNWQRKVTLDLDAVFSLERVGHLLDAVHRARST